MAKIKYTKSNQCHNKHLIQDIIYEWISKETPSPSALLLAGKYPKTCVTRASRILPRFASIFLYEKDYDLCQFIKNNSLDELKALVHKKRQSLFLFNQDVRHASYNFPLQDLDLCSTFFSKRQRATINMKHDHDTISIIQNRLFFQQRKSLATWKTMIVTVTPRSGIGKTHTVECINSLCHQLGWTITYIDRMKRPHYDGYGKGKYVDKSGAFHRNGGFYYAYEHSVDLEKLPVSLDQTPELHLRMFTYTDTQPMITFVLRYK